MCMLCTFHENAKGDTVGNLSRSKSVGNIYFLGLAIVKTMCMPMHCGSVNVLAIPYLMRGTWSLDHMKTQVILFIVWFFQHGPIMSTHGCIRPSVPRNGVDFTILSPSTENHIMYLSLICCTISVQ